MIMRKFKTQFILYFALFATVMATIYFKYQENRQDEANEESQPVIHAVLNGSLSPKTGSTKPLNPQNVFLSDTNLFEVKKKPVTVEVAPPQVQFPVAIHAPIQSVIMQPVATASAPTPPPLPFKFFGKIFGDGEYQVFLSYQGKNHVLKAGDVIQELYKIEEIKPPTMVVNYVPLNQLQQINIGE